ncbi:ClpP/crotonase-like domain-containing protein [Exophiala viscosa]|uniref:ClpP/crotonase-like domain-containing protein n=1 Tax=Exophiala viscosa TaxID=2486360 RepID=A0AAN6DPL2_9EURO|nr:ClpP/crotonase-like domain-containing protein [Exophiala viscosa]KAI1620782.1 ClpP/crotonase-like domain-containing protein [Exophiala viscosa]
MSPPGFSNFKFFNVTVPSQHVVHVEINRPEKMNAFYGPMWFELKAIFEQVSVDPEVRCVLLSGAGDRAFTAGLDVAEASKPDNPLTSPGAIDPSRKATILRRHILELQDVVSSLARCEKPIIALMHGYTFGLGIDLSSACDIRFCLADTKFCVKEVDIGLAADVGTLSRLPKVVGGVTSWVKEICLSARVFSAEEAKQNNFVSRVISGGKAELLKEGLSFAQYIAGKSPVAVQGTKAILDAAWGRTVEDNLNYTAVWNAGMLQSTDVQRAMLSGLRKKTPTFEKL